MGAPAAILATALKSRTVHRVLIGLLTFGLVTMCAILVPLVAVPLALAAHAAPAPAEAHVGSTPLLNGEWGYPLAGSYAKGRGFGYNPVQGCGYCSTNHQGYDMAQECGAVVYASGPGTVITAGAYGGYGNAVRIDHGGGVVTLYGHMQWDSLRVAVGQAVSAGTPLGSEGNTGKSFGCHLHFEVSVDGAATPPEPFMANLGLPLA